MRFIYENISKPKMKEIIQSVNLNSLPLVGLELKSFMTCYIMAKPLLYTPTTIT